MTRTHSDAIRSRESQPFTGYHCLCCDRGCVFGLGRVRIIGRDHRILWVNSEITGIPMAELLGRKVADVACEADRTLVTGAVEAVFRTGKTQEILARDRFRRHHWLLSLSQAFAAGGEVGAVLEVHPVCEFLFELSRSQRRILYKLAIGWNVERIANHYAISANTVRTQILRARSVMRASDMSVLLHRVGCHRHVLAKYTGSPILSRD